MEGAEGTRSTAAAAGGPLDAFETPVGVIDIPRVRANARRASAYCARHGIRWRPHVKTHKSVDVARLQLEEGAHGLTVATPHEAEVMASVTDDLLLAYPPIGASKVERLVALPASVDLTVGLDSTAALDPLARAASRAGRTIGILVEIDAGLGRVGVTRPEDTVALAGRAADGAGTELRGIMFYPGHLRVAAAEQDEGLAALATLLDAHLGALEDAGLPAAVVSGGSTPTLWQTHRLPQVTEVRPGTCIYNDRDILQMGACEDRDLAYSVLATVVSTAVPGQAVVDAGSKALAKETLRAGGGGFGAVLGRPEVRVRALSEEHGVLDLSDTDWRPEVGDRLRLVPNHVCVSVNLQDHVVALTDEGPQVWPLDGRGRGPYRTVSSISTA